MKLLSQRQYLDMMLMHFKIHGSEVTTTAAKTGLVIGEHIATIKKGSGADSNLVTIVLNKPLGLVPGVKFQPVTLDCVCRLDAAASRSTITVRTLLHSALASKCDDADFEMFLVGTEGIREGAY